MKKIQNFEKSVYEKKGHWSEKQKIKYACLLYTSDAADERSSVDLGGRRIIKKKKNVKEWSATIKPINTRKYDTV